ncbi:MAG: hypothetical protein RLZ32_2709 [Gemmatimonadota bacterium]|jgi:hypothetical protein
MRPLLALAALVFPLSACASAGGGGGAAAPRTVSDGAAPRRAILTDGTGVTYSSEPAEQSRRIAAAPVAVMTAVRQVYAGFAIPVTLDDRAAHRIGNPDFYRSREFMGRRMNELLDCGSGMTGPNAATFRIFLSLVTRVQDAPGGESEVRVQLVATARDLTSGSSTDLLPCGSSGRIEQRLLDEIAKRATGGTPP